MKQRPRGAAMIFVLVMASVLFFLLAAAVGTQFAMHQQNKRQAERLQEKVVELGLKAVRQEKAP